MEPIEPGSNTPQGPETAATHESQWPGLWDDLASVKALAERAQGVPHLRHLSLAMVALCQVVENLAQRVEELESPKPCEGCEENAELEQVKTELAMAEPADRPGIFRKWIEKLGVI